MKDFLISFILESIVNVGEIFLFYLLLNHKFQLKKADVSSRLKLFLVCFYRYLFYPLLIVLPHP